MRRIHVANSRLICTLAPPSTSRKVLRPPPVLVAKRRTEVKGAVLVMSERDPLGTSNTPQAWLGPSKALFRYVVQRGDIAPTGVRAQYLFTPVKSPLTLRVDDWRPSLHRKPHLAQMLTKALVNPKGLKFLLKSDVVASNDVIKRLMFPHKSAFHACFVQGVLFLQSIDNPKVDQELLLRAPAVNTTTAEDEDECQREPCTLSSFVNSGA
ncbi:hypothetical protein C8R46DRAFT_257197 [Mycena filopes]|nr:hypothetical protein C8R46DRAFT_257197 [Mycena filopes]